MRSVTSALPSTLSQRVTRTLVAGKYICILRALPSLGLSENSPPFSGSSKAAKTVGLSSEGQHIKSIVPSKATSAAVLRLPMMPWSPIARCAAGLVSPPWQKPGRTRQIAIDRAGEPIGPKESECLPHLAPGDENACQVHEAELDRPHGSLAAPPLTIDIDDMKTR